MERYNRQIILSEIGLQGQEKLNKAKVLVIGAGGLGSPVLLYLAGAGVGTIGIIDADKVELSNLPRQILHDESSIGINKAISAQKEIQQKNAEVKVKTYPFLFQKSNAEELVSEYDFIIDAVDHFETKFLINDICVKKKKPFCHAGVVGYEGQVLTYVPGKGPCFRCIFEEVPPEDVVSQDQDSAMSAKKGIIGPAAGMIGCMQAMEAIKYIVGFGELLTGKLFVMNLLTLEVRIVKFPKRMPGCTACDIDE